MPSNFLNTTAQAMAGGAAVIAGVGQDELVSFGGVWATGDEFTFTFTDGPTGTQVQVGAGNVSGIVPTFSYTFQDKVYILAGATVYFSALGDATTWNDPNASGNGFVTMSNQYNAPENLLALSSFQGRMAFFSRNTVQIYSINANPALWAWQQTLQNTGTLAGQSVQAVGDFDVFFLSDSGIRSLRVLNISLNAYPDDLGAPVDMLITNWVSTLTAAEVATCTGIVEPSRRRYWLFLPGHNGGNGVIYVYSGFRSSKVAAWSTYQPTYSLAGVQTYFTPQNFVIYNGFVYTRDARNVYTYGNPNGTLYDNCTATIVSPYMDMKKPVSRKIAKGIDMVATGDFTTAPTTPCQWQLYGSMDPISGTFEQVVVQSGTAAAPANTVNPTNPALQATNNAGLFPYRGQGTHFAFKAQTTGTGSATFSEVIFLYEETP